MKTAKPRTDVEPMSISFPTPLLGLVDALAGDGERSEFVLGVVQEAMRRKSWPFVASAGSRERLRRHAEKAMRKKEPTTVTRSLAFAAGELAELDAHQRMIGEGRSYYVKACLEHALGIKPHPELFEPTLRP